MKPFWKSRTIIFAFIAFVAIFLDFTLGFDIGQTINESLNSIFIVDGDEISGVNWIAAITLVGTIFMRIITSKPVSLESVKRKRIQ